jgi:phage gpG-like protein
MKFEVKVTDQAVQTALQALAERVRNPKPVLRAIGEDLVSRTKARFNTSTGPDGVGWKPKKKADGRKTLVGETGDLRRQIVSMVAGPTLTILANAPGGYSAIHQFGGPIKRKAGQTTVRHRTNANGELLRSAIMNGKGLIFAKASHKRAVARTFDVAAYLINMPARPYLPVRSDGSLYPNERDLIVAQLQAWIAGEGQA